MRSAIDTDLGNLGQSRGPRVMERNVQPAMLGKTVDEIKGSVYFIQASLTAATTASTSTSPSVTVGSMPFIWEELTGEYSESNGLWTIKITDDGKDQAFMSEKIPLLALIGDNKQPYKILHPHVFDGGSAIMVEGTNNGSGTDTLNLIFIGKRVHDGG